MTIQFDTALGFLSQAHPQGPWCLFAAFPDKGMGPTATATFVPGDEESMRTWLIERDREQRNIYWTVNRVVGMPTSKPAKKDMSAAIYFHVDLDPQLKDGDGPAALTAERERLRTMLDDSALAKVGLPPPTLVVDSGGGFGVFWKLDAPLVLRPSKRDPSDGARVDAIEKINQAIGRLLGADDCWNIDRVMRLPGTTNLPNAKKRAAGRRAAPSSLVKGLTDWDRRYPPSAFRRLATDATTKDTGGGGALPPSVGAKLRELIEKGGSNKDRSRDTFVACLGLARAGLADVAIIDILIDPAHGISAHYRDQSDPRAKATRDLTKVRAVITSEARTTAEDPGPKELMVRRLGEYRQRNVDWFWETQLGKYMPLRELTILVGDDESGKTTLAIHLMARSTVGAEAPLGNTPLRQGTWLWIGLSEDAADVTILPRLRAAGGNPDAVKVLSLTREGDTKRSFSLLTDLEALREELDDITTDDDAPVGIVLCPLNEFIGDVNTWKDAEVRQALAPLIELAKDRDVLLIGIMHPKKSGDSVRILNNITGSGAFHQISRCVLYQKRDEDENGNPDEKRILIFCEKQSLADRKPPPIAFEFESVEVGPRPGIEEDTVNAAGIVWLGTSDKHLREMLDPQRGGGRSANADGAKDWLRECLKDGPVEARLIYKYADDEHISETQLFHASRALGVIKSKAGFGKTGKWTWKLEEACTDDVN